MKKISHNKPQLRFPQFTDAWKNEVFGNVFRERVDYPEEELPLHSLTIDKGVVPKTKRYERSFLVKSKEDAYKVVHEDDFVFNPMNLRFGAIAKHSKKNKVLVSKYYNIFYSNRTHDPTFLELYLRTNKMIGYYNKMAEGTLIEKRRVHFSNFIEFTKPLPELSEQKQIANFFRTVNDWIAYLDKQITSLEEYRKGMMQKIFSQEVRFKDGDGNEYPEWKNYKFTDLYEFGVTNSFSRDKLNNLNTGIFNIHYGDIHTKFSSHFDLAKEDVPTIESSIDVLGKLEKVSVGDIVIADASEDYKDIGKTIEIISTNGEEVVAGLHTILGKNKKTFKTIGFISYLMQSYKQRLKLMKIAQGAKVLGLSKKYLKDVVFEMPCDEEQQKIALFLSSIDKVVASKETQIEKAQEWKKGLLQQMFI